MGTEGVTLWGIASRSAELETFELSSSPAARGSILATAISGYRKTPHEEALFYTHDPTAWLSELINQRGNIRSAIQSFQLVIDMQSQ